MGSKKLTVPKHFKECLFNFKTEGTKSYFSNRDITEWTYEHYARHFALKKMNHETIKQNYTNDLKWLGKRDLPIEVQRYIGRLKKNFNQDKDKIIEEETNGAFIVYGDSNIAVGAIAVGDNNIVGGDNNIAGGDDRQETINSTKKRSRENYESVAENQSEELPAQKRSQPMDTMGQHQQSQEPQQQDAIDQFFLGLSSRQDGSNSITDGECCLSNKEMRSSMNEEEGDNQEECVFVQDGFPAIGTSKSIDIGTPPNNSNSENWELANKFHEYKKAVVEKGKAGILRFESNVHEILALTHVLLIQKTHVDLQINSMGEDVLNNTYNDVVDQFSLEYDNNDFVSELMDINKRLKRAGVKKEDIIPELLAKMMTKKFGSFEYCFLRSLQNIMEEFPENPLQNVKEHDLIHNIIDPVLRPFISSSQCRLRWPEVNADIRKCRTNRTQRPDAILSEVEGVKYSSCIAYGEAKGTDSDNHGRAVDLVRLGIFGKDCLDANRLNHVILFQIIGESVTFYIESLQAEATYTCTQFEKISFPRSCTDIKPFIDDISSFYTIFKAFKSIRQSMDTEYWESNHRETLDTPLYMDIIDKKKSNSRSCFVHYGR